MKPALRTYGREDGAPFMMLHGLLGSGRNFGSLAQRFGERRILCPDLRNHGDSPWDDSCDYRSLAADAIACLDDLGIEKADFLGHSMGGKAAMAIALLHPERTARLAVADIAPVAYRHDHRETLSAMIAAAPKGCRDRDAVAAALSERLADPAPIPFLMQNLRRKDGVLSWRCNLDALLRHMDAIADFPFLGDERRFDGPTLFISGGRSPYVTAAHEDAIRKFFPMAQRHVIDEADHWLHIQRPEAFANAIRRFFDEHASRGP